MAIKYFGSFVTMDSELEQVRATFFKNAYLFVLTVYTVMNY